MTNPGHFLEQLSPEKRALFESLMRKKRGARAATPVPAPPVSTPWETEEWLRATVDALAAILAGLGRWSSGPVTRVRTSHDACVLRVPVAPVTPAGSRASDAMPLYYKAVPRALAGEISVTGLLSNEVPHHLPEILASGDDWYLMASLPGRSLTESDDPGDWCRAMRDFARIQVATHHEPGTLLAAGCADRRLSLLPARLDHLLGQRDNPRFTGAHFFSSLARQQPRLVRAVSRLAALGLPPCLDHGDFHPQNVHVDGERAYFFDFSDSALSHPFFAAHAFLTYVELGFQSVSAAPHHLREAFLEPWMAHVPRDVLDEAFAQCRPLATLHHLLNMGQSLVERPHTPAGRGRVLYRLAQLEAYLQTCHVAAARPDGHHPGAGRTRVRRSGPTTRATAVVETPWENPGWFDVTCAELGERLFRLGLEPVAPIARLHSSQDSCVLHIALSDRSLYFKAVPRYFLAEVSLARLLGRDVPQFAPRILDAGYDWYLMAAMPGRPLSEARQIDTWCRAMRDFARIQMAYVERTRALFDARCRNRVLAGLVGRVDQLLARRSAVCFTGVSIFGDLERSKPAIQRAIERLASLGIPETLEHGDFHPHNIYADESAACGEVAESPQRDAAPTIFFDFSDGSVSHPFFSPLVLLGFLEHSHPQLMCQTTALRDAYLEPWQRSFPRQRLVAAFDAARPLAKLSYLLNVGECIANRPRPAPEETVDMRQAMVLCSHGMRQALSVDHKET